MDVCVLDVCVCVDVFFLHVCNSCLFSSSAPSNIYISKYLSFLSPLSLTLSISSVEGAGIQSTLIEIDDFLWVAHAENVRRKEGRSVPALPEGEGERERERERVSKRKEREKEGGMEMNL